MRLKLIPVIFLALAHLTLLCGCKHATTAPDGVAMSGGQAISVFPKSVPEMTDTVRAMMLERKLWLSQYSSDPKLGRVVAYTRESQRIEVDIRPDPAGSRVTITTQGNAADQISMDLLKALRKLK